MYILSTTRINARLGLLSLQFSWHALPDREKKRHSNPAEPVYSPTMAGGLFSIDKKFFEKLGTYDSGFDIWGGENLELSFKVGNPASGGAKVTGAPRQPVVIRPPLSCIQTCKLRN